MRKLPLRYLLWLPLCLLAGCGAEDVPPPATPLAPNNATPLLDNYTITSGAAGGVQLGMPSAEILAKFPAATAQLELDSDRVEWVNLSYQNEPLISIMLDKNTHTASLIRVLSPRFHTEQGVRVGENLQSASDKLGGLNEIQWTEIESREFATFNKAPDNMVFQVVAAAGTAGIYKNGETSTTLASPSAAIHSIWLMQE